MIYALLANPTSMSINLPTKSTLQHPWIYPRLQKNVPSPTRPKVALSGFGPGGTHKGQKHYTRPTKNSSETGFPLHIKCDPANLSFKAQICPPEDVCEEVGDRV